MQVLKKPEYKAPERETPPKNTPWRKALFAILAVGIAGTTLRSACKQDRPHTSTGITTPEREGRRPRVRLISPPQTNYFSTPQDNPFILSPLMSGVLETDMPTEAADTPTPEEARLARNRQLCAIGTLVAQEVQGRISQNQGRYSFALLDRLIRETLDSDYNVPGAPTSDNPAHSMRVRTCIEDVWDEAGNARRGSAQQRQILAAGGSIPAILGTCDNHSFRNDDTPTPETINCLHDMLDERITRLSGTELQGLFERIFETNPHLAPTFFTGASREVQAAILAALRNRITVQSNHMSQLVTEHAATPEYAAWQLGIMRPLSEYQDILDGLSTDE